ncbi:hypothetical protein PU683_22230, partial [Kosakonia cowanii]|uniref:hypothetical protein n=1 Tax=Kosakonia cowanii TaxID=208223 RepID=UPI0023FA15F6
ISILFRLQVAQRHYDQQGHNTPSSGGDFQKLQHTMVITGETCGPDIGRFQQHNKIEIKQPSPWKVSNAISNVGRSDYQRLFSVHPADA